jgi:mono/diheme cytochrome c family protein
MKSVGIVVITLVVLLVVATAVVYSGSLNIAADDPHWRTTSRLIETLRDRSISRQAKDVAVPASLDDAKSIASGAGEYAEMCTGCHLAPGMKDTEMRQGLYPKPPELAKHDVRRTSAEQFWIIKHGLKMTGMPAWGPTHKDDRIWSMVAFLRKLPGMTPAQYQTLLDSGEGGHHHDEGEEHEAETEAALASETKTAPAGHAHDDGGHAHEKTPSTTTLSAEAAQAAAVADRFQKLLAQGKTREASMLLDPSILIFEGGGAEKSRAEYASRHLKADSEFLKNANVAMISRAGNTAGDLAWIATESRLKTEGSKPLDLLSTETMVLKRTPDGWRVMHIHWSSKAKK